MSASFMRFFSSLLLTMFLASGCAGMSSRAGGTPRPEACPKGAIEAMRARDIWVGDSSSVAIDRFREDDQPVTLYAGPVESALIDNLGALPAGSLLFGYLWTEGPEVIVRYYEAMDSRGARFPFCGIAYDDGGLEKLPGSAPGMAIIMDDLSALWIVDAFREKEPLPDSRVSR